MIKPGTIAQISDHKQPMAERFRPHIGKVVTVVGPGDGDGLRCKPQLYSTTGTKISWIPEHLVPLSNPDIDVVGTGEIREWIKQKPILTP